MLVWAMVFLGLLAVVWGFGMIRGKAAVQTTAGSEAGQNPGEKTQTQTQIKITAEPGKDGETESWKSLQTELNAVEDVNTNIVINEAGQL